MGLKIVRTAEEERKLTELRKVKKKRNKKKRFDKPLTHRMNIDTNKLQIKVS